jgi:hypothetical protein
MIYSFLPQFATTPRPKIAAVVNVDIRRNDAGPGITRRGAALGSRYPDTSTRRFQLAELKYHGTSMTTILWFPFSKSEDFSQAARRLCRK